MAIQAINSKHQKTVNWFVSWNVMYDKAVNDYDAKNTCDTKRPKQVKAYVKAAEYWELLPKREQANLIKRIDTLYANNY